jgi:prevent-host-death family protein
MEVTTKELRIQPGKIIDQVSVGQEITVTYRGKPLAKIIPFKSSISNSEDTTIFGMWKNHNENESVEDYVRTLRKGRKF